MKRLRTIPVFAVAAAAALLFVQALPSQTSQVTEAPAKAVKKAATKTKAAAEKAAQETGAAARSVGKETTGAAEKAIGQTPEMPKTGRARSATTGSAARAVPTVPESEISSARASGKVWVNTETGVYHKGGRWYGATKHGKFMTEDEAIQGGYRASKGK
jgi:hypothetical protein